jgi:phosphomannomutase
VPELTEQAVFETVDLVAFDLDDTLAPSKSTLPPRMAELIADLLALSPVSVISGGQFGQFRSQLIAGLPASAEQHFDRLHLLPTCGTQYYRYDGGWELQYAENLTDVQKSSALTALEANAVELGLWESETWGPILEDRGSQITFSALGQEAPVDAKKAWDPTGTKKESLRAAIAPLLPELEVRSGGSTSIDITRKGIDKAYGMNKLAALTGVPLERMLFVGDRLDEGGNDYPVKAMGVRTHAVEGWHDTADFIEAFIASKRKLAGN